MIKSNKEPNLTTDDPELWWKMKQQHEKNMVQEETDRHQLNEPLNITDAKKSLSFFSHFKMQFYVAVFIFIIFVVLQKLDDNKPIKLVSWIEAQMNNQIPFTEIATWYEQTFSGSPSFIPTFDTKSQQVISKHGKQSIALPVPDGLVIRSFADSLTGIELSTEKGAEVFAVDEGRVVFVREEADTVIIQHSNKYVTIYSKLSSTHVELNQWVHSGEKIGSMSNTQQNPLLFYAIKKEDRYIDPLGVISFD